MAKREATIYGFPTRRYPRNDGAVGMVFHRFEQRGTPTYINAVVELGGDVSLDELTRVVDEKLLRRFPRWRGHVSPHDEQHWVVPESVDPSSYIEEVPFVHGDFREALMEHVSSRLRDPLPDGCSWQVHKLSGVGQTALFFRISHTIADAVLILAIVNAIFEKDEDATPPPPAGSGGGGGGRRAGACERLGAMIGGLWSTMTLPCMRGDTRTPISLGPVEWRRRAELREQRGVESQGADFGVAEPVNVDLVKRVAKSHGATINDIVLAAIAEGVRTYINDVDTRSTPPQDLTLTATIMVNPRPQKPSSATGSLNGTERLLADYAEMRGQGCDLAGAFVPLPCGDMQFSDRLQRVSATTRRMKLSMAPLLLRWGNNLALKCFGTSFIVRFSDYLFGKTSLVSSSVIFSKAAVKLCGVPVTAIYAASAPATWGANVTHTSYNGELRIVAVTDKETIGDAGKLANLVRSALVEACKSDEKQKSWVDTEIDRIRNAAEAV
jgi:hypothetical protein